MRRKRNRVALVSGGAKRVGRAIVQRLIDEGFEVAYTHLHSPKLPGRAVAIKADLRDPDQASEYIYREFVGRFDRLDVLVNNAAVYEPGTLQETTMQLMRETAAVNVQSVLLLCQKFEAMLRKSRGQVINMVDLLAERPWQEYLIYCASKAALANLTMGLARELAPEVTVNGIAPGVVDWPRDFPKADRKKYLKRVPLRRAGTPEDVASLVHFLVTEGKYITGQIIRLDGGRSIT